MPKKSTIPTDREEMEEALPGNSLLSKVAPVRPEEPIPNEPIGRKRIKTKARGMRRPKSILGTIFSENTKAVGSYVVQDVIVPTVKTLLAEMVTTAIEMFLYGEAGTGRTRRRERDRNRTIVSYGSMYNNRDDRPAQRPESRTRRGSNYRNELDNIFFQHGDEATEVLSALCEQLEEYQQVTVADFLELANVPGATWADQKWGWEDLQKAYCTHTRHGYAVVLPSPIELS